MRVELDDVKLGYSPLSESIFAGVHSKPGIWRHKVNVTESFVFCVIEKYKDSVTVVSDGKNEWEITVKKVK
jgi:hypothetical protein